MLIVLAPGTKSFYLRTVPPKQAPEELFQRRSATAKADSLEVRLENKIEDKIEDKDLAASPVSRVPVARP